MTHLHLTVKRPTYQPLTDKIDKSQPTLIPNFYEGTVH
jgi:hypothetical protein